MFRSPQRRSPFESPSQKLLGTRQIVRFLRNGLIVAAVTVLLIDQVGEPMLRWEYRYRGSSSNPHIINATYLGVRGRIESGALDHVGDCPLVLFAKPNPPLWRQASDRVLSLLP
jgi:hypothetical protein